MSAAERRESVIRAAITEFGRGGYDGTSTAAIARRVGVSQPYLFRLFPDKRAIFLAAAERCSLAIGQTFERAMEEAGEGLSPADVEETLGHAYARLITRDSDLLMFQMQMYLAALTARTSGDEAFAEVIRGYWRGLWDAAHLVLGADTERTGEFFGTGMLINVLLSMGFPGDDPVWTACGEAFLSHLRAASAASGPPGPSDSTA